MSRPGFDPTRTSKLELTKAQVARRVNFISMAKMPEDGNWNWGMEPHSRADPPELLFFRQGIEDSDLLQKIWTADHVDPADQAGDDDLPEADDQGGQGEHNPPPSPEQGEDEPASSAASPIRAVPLAARPPSTSATSSSAPKGKKRVGERSTAALEARARKQRRLGPKKVPEAPGAAIKFAQGAGSGSAPAADSGMQRRRREPTPQPPSRPRTPPVVPPPLTGAVLSSAAPRQVLSPPALVASRRRAPARLRSTRCSRAASGSWALQLEPAGELGGLRLPQPESVGLRPRSLSWTRDRMRRRLRPANAVPARTVADRRTALYNRLVVGYHKAKNERAEMARELEAAKAVAARVPQLEADLRAARERCATAEETTKAVTAKAQETHGELERLRRLESNHIIELKAARETGRKEVEDLSRRLKDVEEQSRALRDEVTSKSQELTDTAKRWVSQMSALDRGLAGLDRAIWADMALSFVLSWYNEGAFIADPNPPEDDSDEEPEDEEIEMEAPPGARSTGPPPAGA
ncbi:hypothetical protein QYE76_012624 [Lolium multiflorum]|uniref:Uncharacterized protein n=1 Tax=Lolium multiflorum TaxID=4521 RepID=A0AAD8X6G2_LOLMU|nr:hypothetical protein QYE76_012624 [Lolium multiflorum]